MLKKKGENGAGGGVQKMDGRGCEVKDVLKRLMGGGGGRRGRARKIKGGEDGAELSAYKIRRGKWVYYEQNKIWGRWSECVH